MKNGFLVFLLSLCFSLSSHEGLDRRIEKKLSESFYSKPLMSKKITLKSRSCSIQDIVSLISASTGIDFIVDKDVTFECGPLNFSQREVGEILDILCSSGDPRLGLMNHRGVWRIMHYQKAYSMTKRSWKEVCEKHVFALKHIRCDDRFAQKLEKMWGAITRGAKNQHMYCTVDIDSKKIFVKAPKRYAQELEHFLDEIDCIGQQVRIDAIVAIADKNYEYGLGFNWAGIYDRQASVARGIKLTKAGVTSESFGVNFMTRGVAPLKLPLTFGGAGPGLARLNIELQAAEQEERVKILLRPSVLASHNENAEILIGKSIPIKTMVEDLVEGEKKSVSSIQYKEVGTILNVRPFVSPNNQTVLLDIWVEDSSASDNVSVDKAPVIKTIRTKNKILLKSGQTTVIGGLMINRSVHRRAGVPGLQALPLVGRLFRGTRKIKEDNELLIFITPTIV